MPRPATCCSLGVADNPTLALVAYNCGNPGPACQAASAGYAEQVLATAASYTAPGAAGCAERCAGGRRLLRRVADRHPLRLRRRDAPEGFDCSGLVVWAYGLAGVVVPRVANDQWHDEPHVALNDLVPGDLVFFGSGDYADHVGIYIGDSAMVDAPYTGADVRVDTIPLVAGAAWGATWSCSVRLIRWPPDGVASDVWLAGWGDRPAAPRREQSRTMRIDVGPAPRDSVSQGGARTPRRTRAAQLSSTSLPIDEAAAADPFRWLLSWCCCGR